jgi:hypothetical protein
MVSPPKTHSNISGVFEFPLLRNAQKRHKRKKKEKKGGTYLPHLVAIWR